MSEAPVQFIALSHSMPKRLAMALMEALEEAIIPEASAATMDETDEANELWQVTAYYTEEPDGSAFGPILAPLSLASSTLSIEKLPETDWIAQSLEGLKPVVAGRFYVHGGHDPKPRLGGVSLLIDAGTAFGTGHHGTTRGCLLALDAILKVRESSGVASVIASQLSPPGG